MRFMCAANPFTRRLSTMQFGAALFELRTRNGMSQGQLARTSNLSCAYVSTVENGRRRPPPPKTLERLADALALDSAEREVLQLTATIERAYDFAAREANASAEGCLRIARTCLDRP